MAAEPVARQTDPVLVPFGAPAVSTAPGRGETESRSRPRRPAR